MVTEASTSMLLTFVYASNDLVRRRDLWAELVALSTPAKLWVVMGYFNAVLSIDDRRGTRVTSARECDEFAGMIFYSDLTQIEHAGPYFTWHRGSKGSRLDRVFFNK